MDLGLSDEQAQLVETVAALLGKASTSEVVRASEPLGFDADLWRGVNEVGLIEMAAPASVGGGATMVDLALVAEELGRHLAPVPVVESVATVRLIAKCAPDDLASAFDGTPRALALHPVEDGLARFVPGGAVAAAFVALAGDRLVLSTDDTSRPVETIGRSPVAHRAVGPSSRLLVSGPEAVAAHRSAVDEWRVLTANSLVGLAAGALELAVDYAKVRHQFGVPIGSFQALAHRLADEATLVDGARLLARKAAWAVDDDPGDAARLAAMAFTWCAEVAAQVAADCVHIHGGMGFSVECDAQLFFRRAVGWPYVLHGVREGRLAVADVLWPAGER